MEHDISPYKKNSRVSTEGTYCVDDHNGLSCVIYVIDPPASAGGLSG